jgi:hypothetical protein
MQRCGSTYTVGFSRASRHGVLEQNVIGTMVRGAKNTGGPGVNLMRQSKCGAAKNSLPSSSQPTQTIRHISLERQNPCRMPLPKSGPCFIHAANKMISSVFHTRGKSKFISVGPCFRSPSHGSHIVRHSRRVVPRHPVRCAQCVFVPLDFLKANTKRDLNTQFSIT